RPGELVTREELQKLLWNDDVNVDSNHGLNAAVNKLRDALNDAVEEPTYIETLPRRGYRFIGTIQAELPQLIQPAAIPVTAVKEQIAVVPPAVAARRSRAGYLLIFAGAAMLLVGVPVAAFLSRNQEMAENMWRMVRKDVAENLAAAARSSQAQPDMHRSNTGEANIPEAKRAGEAEVLARRKRADQGAGNGELRGTEA